jgi:methionine synthase II (cobalamin-independent)
MARRHMSDIAGRLFPASFVGSYPRPSWYSYNLRSRDIVEALQEEEFAEAYKDGLRAQMGDQEEVGLDILADPHLWYDKHQGFIGSFALYNTQRLTGTETRVATNPAMAQIGGDAGWMEVFGTIAQTQVAVTQKLTGSTMHHAVNWTLARRATSSDRPVKAFFAMGPIELSAVALVDEHYHDRKALLRDLGDIFHNELVEAVKAGATIVELDDLIFIAPQEEWAFDVEILNRVFDGVDAYKIWHCCHGGTPAPVGIAPYEAMFPYVKDLQVDSFDWSFAQTNYPDQELKLFADCDVDLGLGVISNKNYLIETPQEVAAGIRKAVQYVAPERIHLTSDCGLFAYSRPAAKAKLRAAVKGADLVRQEMGVKGHVAAPN